MGPDSSSEDTHPQLLAVIREPHRPILSHNQGFDARRRQGQEEVDHKTL